MRVLFAVLSRSCRAAFPGSAGASPSRESCFVRASKDAPADRKSARMPRKITGIGRNFTPGLSLVATG